MRDVAKVIDVPASTLGGYFGGRHLPPLTPPTLLVELLRACGVTEPDAVNEWLEVLRRVRRSPARRNTYDNAPYRGLACFEPEDAERFFGRERLTHVVVDRVLADDHESVLVVVGASGSGKSSVLRAGVVPALREAPSTRPVEVVLLTPGAHPLATLTEALESVDVGSGRDVVVIVDQFEEVFTECRSEDERAAFVAAVCKARVVLALRADFYPQALRYGELARALQHAQVVVGPMTEDELRSAICEPARACGADVEDVLVEVLLRDLAPPASAGASRGYEPGTLPLLSHALAAAWQLGDGSRLTLADYQRTGGLHGAVTATAEAVYERLDDGEKAVARALFLRLVNVVDDVVSTRRVVARADFAGHLDDDVAATFEAVLLEFVEQRLLTLDTDSVQLAHEALLAAWPRLREWIEADRARLRAHRQLVEAADAWRDAGHDPNVLYRGGRLALVREWLTDPVASAQLSPHERAFVSASAAAQDDAERAARRQTSRLHRLLAALTALVLIAGFLAGYAFRQRTEANRSRDLAISRQVAIAADQLRATDPALAAQLALAAYRVARTPEARASLLDAYASPALTRVLGPPGVLQSVAVTTDGSLMAAGGTDGAVRLWDITDPVRPRRVGAPLSGFGSTVFSVAFGPGKRVLAVGGSDREVALVDVADPRSPRYEARLRGATNTVYSVAFDHSGRVLAEGSADDRVRLWDVARPDHPVPIGPPLRGPTGYVQSVAFSPDGATLAAGSADGRVWLWRLRDRTRPDRGARSLAAGGSTVFSVAFDATGSVLAAGTAAGTISVWRGVDRRTGPRRARVLTGPTTWVNGVTFSPDGSRLAAASSDSKVWLWDLAAGRPPTQLPHPGPVTSVAFAPDGRTLVTSAADGTARLWHLPGPVLGPARSGVFTLAFTGATIAAASTDDTITRWRIGAPRRPAEVGRPVRGPTGEGGFSGTVATSADGRLAVAGSEDGSVRLWRVDGDSWTRLGPALSAGRRAVQSVAVSPDGSRVAAGGNDARVLLWDTRDPRHPRRIASLGGFTNYVLSVTFSPDGRLLAAGSADHSAQVWSVAGPARPVRLARLNGPQNYVYAVAFAPGSDLLALGSADDTVRLWSVDQRGARPLGRPLTGPHNYVYAVAFSPDGRTLAAGSGNGSIWLWDVHRPDRPRVLAALADPSGAVFAVTFDRHSGLLASGDGAGLVRLWDTNPDRVASRVCAVVGDGITAAEWSEYVPGVSFRPPCRGKPAGPRE